MIGPPLAALITPALAYAGLAAVSVPIVIHLLSKRRFHKVRWAAMDFLLEANRRNRRRIRLEELILLGLRCLAMLLAGLMLGRVFLRPHTLMALLGSSARSERIIVLDDSYSMGALVHGQTQRGPGAPDQGSGTHVPVVFDRATASVDRLVRWLREESPGDALTILVTSRPERPLRSAVSLDKLDTSALSDELRGLAPSSRAGNLPATLQRVRAMLEGRGSLNAAVYVVSDFQRIDWENAGINSRGPEFTSGGPQAPGMSSRTADKLQASPAAALAGWADERHNLRLMLVDVGTDATRNLCVSGLEPRQAQAVATVSGSYVARVTNYGDSESPPTTMQVYVGDAAQPEVPVPAIAAGQTAEVAFEVAFPTEGSETLTVELPPDDLPADNTRSLVVPVARAVRILLVNGEPSTDPYQDEAYLLSVALRPEGPQFSGNELTVVDENEFESTDLGSCQVVLLANVYRMTEEMAGRLEEFAAAGGGVGIFLGDQVDAELYNRILYRGGNGLLPARLGEVGAPPAGQPGVGVGDLNVAHPAMQRFRNADVPYFAGVLAYHWFENTPAEAPATAPAAEMSSRGVETPASAPAGTNSHGPATHPAHERAPVGPAQVLARLTDSDRSPLIIERPFGDGRGVLITTSADKEWTNLPDRPVYVVLAMELVQYLTRPMSTPAADHVLVGQPITLSLDPAQYRPAATLRLPSFPETPEAQVDARPDPQIGAPALTWPATDRAGIYRFGLTEASGGQHVRLVAVNVDPREGDLHRAGRAALLEAAGRVPVEYVDDQILTQVRDTGARRELWPILLIALLVVLMSEQALAWWFGSGRQSVVASPGRRAGVLSSR